MKVSIKELRRSTKEVIEAVDRGNTVLITYRGKPRAKIISLKERPPQETKDNLFGIWEDNEDVRSVEKYIDKIRKGR